MIKKRILFVEEGRPSATGGFGGSLYSMLETIKLFQSDESYKFFILTYYEVPVIYNLIDVNKIEYHFIVSFTSFLNSSEVQKVAKRNHNTSLVPFFIKTDLMMYSALSRARDYFRIINLVQPDLIWGNNMTSGNFAILVSSFLKGIPYLQHQRAALACISFNYFIALLCTKKIVAISNYVHLSLLNNIITKYLFNNKIVTVHNFNENFRNEKIFLEKSLTGIKLIFMGRIIPQKNIEEFLLISSKICKSLINSQIKIEVYGDWEDDKYQDSIKILVDFLGLSEIINFHPFSNTKLIFSNDKMNFLFHTTKRDTPEPFGRVLIDAISFGAIVFTNGYGGAGEVIKHNFNGFVYDVNNLNPSIEIVRKFCSNSDVYFSSLNKFYQNTAYRFSGITQYELLNPVLRNLLK